MRCLHHVVDTGRSDRARRVALEAAKNEAIEWQPSTTSSCSLSRRRVCVDGCSSVRRSTDVCSAYSRIAYVGVRRSNTSDSDKY